MINIKYLLLLLVLAAYRPALRRTWNVINHKPLVHSVQFKDQSYSITCFDYSQFIEFHFYCLWKQLLEAKLHWQPHSVTLFIWFILFIQGLKFFYHSMSAHVSLVLVGVQSFQQPAEFLSSVVLQSLVQFLMMYSHMYQGLTPWVQYLHCPLAIGTRVWFTIVGNLQWKEEIEMCIKHMHFQVIHTLENWLSVSIA